MDRVLITTSSFAYAPLRAEYEYVFNPFGRCLSEQEAMELILQYQPVGMIAGVEPLTARVLARAEKLRVISRCGVGTDAIDLAYARQKGIELCTTPEAPVESVAELALGMALSLLRRLSESDRMIKAGNWKKLPGWLLAGKTVGIVGCGRIGSRVAELMNVFGCVCIGYDPLRQAHPLCAMTELDSLLKTSDIVTLHVPLSPDTRGLIGERALSLMREDAILLNTSRGGLIDEEALYMALCAGKFLGVGLDVYGTEPYQGKLCGFERVLLTPHIGSGAREARAAMERQAAENLYCALEKTVEGREAYHGCH